MFSFFNFWFFEIIVTLNLFKYLLQKAVLMKDSKQAVFIKNKRLAPVTQMNQNIITDKM